MPYEENDTIPVYIITGLLESGKTAFLEETIEQDYFAIDGPTLLIRCEEGEEDYDEEVLKMTKTHMVTVDDEKEFTTQWMRKLDETYHPERVLIEYNGMWKFPLPFFPENWEMAQQITTVNAETFNLYFNNMKQQFVDVLRQSDMIICNRCQKGMELSSWKRIIKSVNNLAEIVFENADGGVERILEEDLPYNLKANVIEIQDSAYGIWYLDVMDHLERYEGRKVKIRGMVYKDPKLPMDCFVPGRMAMTCCENDMSFLGYVCRYKEARTLKDRQWVEVTARIESEFRPEYRGNGPVLYAESVTPCAPVKGPVDFNI